MTKLQRERLPTPKGIRKQRNDEGWARLGQVEGRSAATKDAFDTLKN